MPLTITDVATLQDYLIGVMGRADHHAGKVNEIALALAGAIVWRKDNNPIKVMVMEGETKNVLWVTISNIQYAFSYDHQNDEIVMKQGGTQGNIIHRFNNSTSIAEIKRIFESL